MYLPGISRHVVRWYHCHCLSRLNLSLRMPFWDLESMFSFLVLCCRWRCFLYLMALFWGTFPKVRNLPTKISLAKQHFGGRRMTFGLSMISYPWIFSFYAIGERSSPEKNCLENNVRAECGRRCVNLPLIGFTTASKVCGEQWALRIEMTVRCARQVVYYAGARVKLRVWDGDREVIMNKMS